MKTIKKEIILLLAVIFFVTLAYMSHVTYDSQSMYNNINHPAVVTSKDWFNINIKDSAGVNYRFRRNDMLSNTLMNMYEINDTLIEL